MEEYEINIIGNGGQLEQVADILQRFLQNNEMVFSFPNLSDNNRVILWTGLFQHLQNKNSAAIHTLCLAAIRILSRDKTDLENMMCEKWITVLIELAGLYILMGVDEESRLSVYLSDKDVAIEAMKCLCNIAFNSEVARALCAHTSIAQGMVARLRVYKEIPFKDDIMLFDMKLLFVLTALREDIKVQIRDELHGMDYLIDCLKELLLEASCSMDEPSSAACGGLVEGGHHSYLNDKQQAIACDVLKSQFNLVDCVSNERSEARLLKLLPVLTALLDAGASSEQKRMDVCSNVANLLTKVPPHFMEYLTPPVNMGENDKNTYDGRNMDALENLVKFLQYQFTVTTSAKNQYENLTPILTVMNISARGCRSHRKYLRQVVLPPLRDVSEPPEKGSTLRNQMCRLLTTPVTTVRDLAAEFLFVLCKEKVGRMVKYTGFGNACGHLAQKGLLAGGSQGNYSSSSDSSDTEEYLEAQPHIDPVVGCTRPVRADPLHGMTEEQKEYEAMKLVNLFDKMVSTGVVKPARIGPDGRPQAVDHVMQLRDHNRPQS